MSFSVAKLYRYPVKGLSAEALTAADLRPGCGIRFDRAFGLALSTAQYDPKEPQWLPKRNFVTLIAHERLAALHARFDENSGVLTIDRGGKPVARGAVATPIGRAMLEDFFRAYLKDEVAARPKLIGSADGARFFDHPQPALSLIGLATIGDIERIVGRPVDPLRFRANVYLSGVPAWAELDWVGKEISIGTARLSVTDRIARCPATNVDPTTGIRDMTIPRDLQRVFGHTDCGVLAVVTNAGEVALGHHATLAPI
jgi:MOSC domain-containing protein